MKARHKFQENFPNIKFPENSQQLTYNYDKKCHILFVSKTVHYKNIMDTCYRAKPCQHGIRCCCASVHPSVHTKVPLFWRSLKSLKTLGRIGQRKSQAKNQLDPYSSFDGTLTWTDRLIQGHTTIANMVPTQCYVGKS